MDKGCNSDGLVKKLHLENACSCSLVAECSGTFPVVQLWWIFGFLFVFFKQNTFREDFSLLKTKVTLY